MFKSFVSYFFPEEPILPTVEKDKIVLTAEVEKTPVGETSQETDFWSRFWWNVLRVGVTAAGFTAIVLSKSRSSVPVQKEDGPYRELFQTSSNGTKTSQSPTDYTEIPRVNASKFVQHC